MNRTADRVANFLSYVIALVLVALPFHALFIAWAGSNFGHIDLARIWKEIIIVILVLPVSWLALRSARIRGWLYHSWIARLYALYILLHLLLGVWALSNHQVNKTALIYALIVNLRFIGFFLICSVIATYSDFLRNNWRKILLLPAAAVILFGLLQEFLLPYSFLRHFGYGPKTIPAYQTVDNNINYVRIQSTLRGANPLGAYLVLIITAMAALWRRNKYLYGGGILAALAVIFYSYSRSAWLGLVISLAILGWWMVYRPKHRNYVLAGVITAFLVFGGGLYSQRNNKAVQNTLFHSSSSSADYTSSNAVRLSDLENAGRQIVHQPLGRGPGTAGPASFRNSPHPARIAENYYLQIGQEVGVLGAAVFVAINILVALQLWQRRREALSIVLLASLIGISCINMLSHAWADDTLSLLWWGLAGIAIAPAILKPRNQHKQNGKTQKTSA